MNATAFGRNNPFGSKLNAIFSSDIGIFDVVDMRDPLPEAYELVEDGHITADNFRDFTFANAVRLWGTQNPRFFEGTRVAKDAAAQRRRRLLAGLTTVRAGSVAWLIKVIIGGHESGRVGTFTPFEKCGSGARSARSPPRLLDKRRCDAQRRSRGFARPRRAAQRCRVPPPLGTA